ncbi:MAG: hypothetical protein NTV25_05700 [Methanothrix sp.]|nr:hypothetical protein [Methanothrix sp.]
MISAKLAGLFLALLLIFASLGLVEARQLFLNVYVDNTNTKQVLVVGNVDDPVGLPFLNSSEHIYEENGQLYAVTDSLLEKEDRGWRLKLPLSGYYDEYHAVFYVPGSFELKEINCSRGLEFLSSTYNGSIVLDVQGFDLTDPEVSLSYRAA